MAKSSGLSKRTTETRSFNFDLGKFADATRASFESGFAAARETIAQLNEVIQSRDATIKELHALLEQKDRRFDDYASKIVGLEQLKVTREIAQKKLELAATESKELGKIIENASIAWAAGQDPVIPVVRRVLVRIFKLPVDVRDQVRQAIGDEDWKALLAWAQK